MNQDKIGNFIKKIRLENNLTQKDLADRLGVTFQAVSKWENGKNVPDIAIMKQISEEFHINIDELLNGEKQRKKKSFNFITIIPILFIILAVIITTMITNHKEKDFEFKTISPKCSAFKITGSAAYNKEKASIYISNIEFCGEEDLELYEEITCTLYQTDEKSKTKISICDKKNNITLEDYLKDVNINVNDNSNICKNIPNHSLVLEINAKAKDNKTITYSIPLKLNDNCK